MAGRILQRTDSPAVVREAASATRAPAPAATPRPGPSRGVGAWRSPVPLAQEQSLGVRTPLGETTLSLPIATGTSRWSHSPPPGTTPEATKRLYSSGSSIRCQWPAALTRAFLERVLARVAGAAEQRGGSQQCGRPVAREFHEPSRRVASLVTYFSRRDGAAPPTRVALHTRAGAREEPRCAGPRNS